MDEAQGQGGGQGAAFDPSNPPAGYSLCHAGHCHHESGRLVSYEEIAIELSGGRKSFVPLVRLHHQTPFDLWRVEPVEINDFDPSRELRQGRVSKASVRLGRLTAEGSVSGGPSGSGLGDKPLPLNLDLDLTGVSLDKLKDINIDRDGPGEFELEVRLLPSGTLFDEVVFSELKNSSGKVVLSDRESIAGLAVIENLQDVEFSVVIDDR